MNRIPPLIIPVFVLLVIILTGCLPATYDHSALCGDRDVVFCEDFEGLSQSVFEQSSGGSLWEVMDDGWLSNWEPDLPVNGRSPRYLASIGLVNGNYDDNSEALLFTQILDLTEASSATLYFNLLHLTESSWDGMIVVATSDGGNSWIILEPKGGYSGTVKYGGSIIQGYSGRKPYWTHEEVDLVPILGLEVNIGFYFLSDGSVTNFGVVLDDIVVDADIRAQMTQETLIRDMPEVNLVLPQDPLVITEIPRANTLADIPCEGEQEEILKEGQRAFTKAVNETGDRYLVLHPESGNFCWIATEDVWIDGEDSDLPQLSDKRPEDLFLPVCVLNRSPLLNDLVCLSSLGAEEYPTDLISYYLHSAYVKEGKIQTILIDPGNGPGGNAPQDLPDPRVGELSNVPKAEPGYGPGGNLEVSLNGVRSTCLLDREQPGRVICEDLSLNPTDPLGVEICWQGWDDGSRCPPGFAANQGGPGCLILSNLDACTPECPKGYQFSPDEGLCFVNIDMVEEKPELCPEGFSVNPQASCCATSDTTGQEDCPQGYYFAPVTSVCLRFPGEGTCPEGYISQEEPPSCIPEIGTSVPICTAFEVKFPKSEVTVKETTRCGKGPGSSYETVSSLKAFTIVEVLGVGEVNGYLVINNPRYQIPCWVAETDLYIDKLDKTILPVIPVEPDDTAQSQGSNPQGCLVAVDMTSAPNCMAPCPDPVKYPSLRTT